MILKYRNLKYMRCPYRRATKWLIIPSPGMNTTTKQPMPHKNGHQRNPGQGEPTPKSIWPFIVAIALWFGAVAYFLREAAALARQLEVLERCTNCGKKHRIPGTSICASCASSLLTGDAQHANHAYASAS